MQICKHTVYRGHPNRGYAADAGHELELFNFGANRFSGTSRTNSRDW
jgi:hypothetical protein